MRATRQQDADAPPRWRIVPELQRTARLYRRVDHADPASVRREAARQVQASRLAGRWTATDPEVQVTDTGAVAGDGPEVAVRVYRPVPGTAPHGGVVYLHGGAFISGDLDFEHLRCLDMCRETKFVVVSVGYRLAPEFPYPAALDDCMIAYKWLCGAGGELLGVDPGSIAVAGTSACGALAAALCLIARDTGLPMPRMQMLLYPVLDDRMETASMRAFTDSPAWDRRNCVHMWNHYLGPPERRGAVSPYAAPARAADLSGLPMAYVMTAEYDPLRDEGAGYAQRLMHAGVPAELHQFSGTFHGFDTLASSAVSRRAVLECHEVLRAALR